MLNEDEDHVELISNILEDKVGLPFGSLSFSLSEILEAKSGRFPYRLFRGQSVDTDAGVYGVATIYPQYLQLQAVGMYSRELEHYPCPIQPQ